MSIKDYFPLQFPSLNVPHKAPHSLVPQGGALSRNNHGSSPSHAIQCATKYIDHANNHITDTNTKMLALQRACTSEHFPLSMKSRSVSSLMTHQNDKFTSYAD